MWKTEFLEERPYFNNTFLDPLRSDVPVDACIVGPITCQVSICPNEILFAMWPSSSVLHATKQWSQSHSIQTLQLEQNEPRQLAIRRSLSSESSASVAFKVQVLQLHRQSRRWRPLILRGNHETSRGLRCAAVITGPVASAAAITGPVAS